MTTEKTLTQEAGELIQDLLIRGVWGIKSYDSSLDDPGDPRGGGVIHWLSYIHCGAELVKIPVDKVYFSEPTGYLAKKEYQVTVGGERVGTLLALGITAQVQAYLDGLTRKEKLSTLRSVVASLKNVEIRD